MYSTQQEATNNLYDNLFAILSGQLSSYIIITNNTINNHVPTPKLHT